MHKTQHKGLFPVNSDLTEVLPSLCQNERISMLQTVKQMVFPHDPYINVYILHVCLSILYLIKALGEEA